MNLHKLIELQNISHISMVKQKLLDDARKYGMGFVIRKKRNWVNPMKYIDNPYKFVNIDPNDILIHKRKN